MSDDENICDTYGHNCKELDGAWKEYNDLHEIYLKLESQLAEAKKQLLDEELRKSEFAHTAIKLQKENEELRKQIEAMKCCQNCESYDKCWKETGRTIKLIRYRCNECVSEKRIWENWQPKKEAV